MAGYVLYYIVDNIFFCLYNTKKTGVFINMKKLTVKDISDTITAFVRDEKVSVDIQYKQFGTVYKFIRYGLADFPYVLEVATYGRNNGALILYRGTTPGTADKRVLFKALCINKNSDSKKNKFEMHKLLEMARLRAYNKIYLLNNTCLLREKLQELVHNSR